MSLCAPVQDKATANAACVTANQINPHREGLLRTSRTNLGQNIGCGISSLNGGKEGRKRRNSRREEWKRPSGNKHRQEDFDPCSCPLTPAANFPLELIVCGLRRFPHVSQTSLFIHHFSTNNSRMNKTLL